METNDALKEKENKFLSLKSELKNEILEFLPIAELFKSCIKINKMFSAIFNRKGILKFTKDNINPQLTLENFTFTETERIKAHLIKLGFNSERIADFVIYFVGLTIKNTTEILIYNIIDIYLKMGINHFWNPDSIIRKNNYDSMILYPLIAFKNNLLILNFDSNSLSNDEKNFSFFCQSLKSSKNLNKLYITRNGIGTGIRDMFYLSDALAEIKGLKHLSLEHNLICNNKMDSIYLSNILKRNQELEILNLNKNLIGNFEIDIGLIFYHIKENQKLKEIYFPRNQIGKFPNDLNIMIDALKYNKVLKEIYLFNNVLSLEESIKLDEELKSQTELKVL